MSGTPITMEMTCKWLDLEPQMKEIIPYDSRTKNLIEGLTEDPEDNSVGFIPTIELHNARLKKAHLLHEATSAIMQQKWVEGTDLENIGKFLQSRAPEPYRDKPMPKEMIHALLDITPNYQEWAPTDLSNCIFRNAEAADSIDELVRSLKSLSCSLSLSFARANSLLFTDRHVRATQRGHDDSNTQQAPMAVPSFCS